MPDHPDRCPNIEGRADNFRGAFERLSPRLAGGYHRLPLTDLEEPDVRMPASAAPRAVTGDARIAVA
jgi:hypothetical protein